MKWIWLGLALLILAAAVVLWQDTARFTEKAAAPAPSSGALDLPPVGRSLTPPPSLNAPAALGAPTAKSNPDSSAAPSTAPLTAPSSAQSSAASAAATELSPPATDRALPVIPNATVKPGAFEVLDADTVVADKRFRISGKGTSTDPYRVSWECLASAQESYVPRLGETQIPERIAMLNGKFVRMEGYISFPTLQQEAQDLLLMLNQWDGCCIGVPPTPYDAIEVKLVEPIKNVRRHASFTYGSLTGRFKVEPFLVENWLVGLYVMEDAIYEPEEL